MITVVIDPPEPVVSLDEAKAHLSVETDEFNDLITGYIEVATAMLDGPTSNFGRALGVQTLEARLDSFWEPVRLRYPPIIAVSSVKYRDGAGIEQTLATDQYEVFGRGELAPAFDLAWPSARYQREGVRIRYTAGHEVLPAPIRQAILLMVGDMFKHRETTVAGPSPGCR